MSESKISHILIVEDEKIIALDLQRNIEKLGYTVIGIAPSGEKALEFLNHTIPQLIIMDIMMGNGMTGIECARIVKDNWDIPVIYLTAYADENILEEAKKTEPYGYIIKPFRLKDLQTTLEIALYKHTSRLADREKNTIIQAILNNTQEGLCTLDHGLTIEYMNLTAKLMFGITEHKNSEENSYQARDYLKLLDAQSLEPIKFEELFEHSDLLETTGLDDVLLQQQNGDFINISLKIGPFQFPGSLKNQYILSMLDISTQKNMAQSIDYQTKHDALTNLPNRSLFLNHLHRVQTSKEYNHVPLYLLLINLDKFKVINEVGGHTTGDQVLREIARDLETKINYHTLGRLSADEFALILEMPPDRIVSVADELRILIERKIPWNSEFFLITTSIGIVRIDDSFQDSQSLMAAVDDAIFLSKRRGGNSIELYSREHKGVKKHRGEMVWVNKIIAALEQDRFILYTQPMKSLGKGLRQKQEILLRMIDEDQKIISPGLFISAAERYRLMKKIDIMVLTKTLLYMEKTKNPTNTLYCINLSGTTFLDDETLNAILILLDDFPQHTHNLCLEITETSAIQNFDRVVQFIHQANDKGVIFALDDFGNGFSSFAYLKKLPISILKIDGSYVRDMINDRASRAMVAAINTMSHELGLLTVAEFVSTEEALQELQKLGVDYAQGYIISEPIPLES